MHILSSSAVSQNAVQNPIEIMTSIFNSIMQATMDFINLTNLSK